MKKFNFSNILITGGCGFVGSHLTEELLSNGNVSITIVDNHFSTNVLPKEIEAKIHLENVDIRNLEKLESIFAQVKPEICFHLAAIHFIPYCIENPNEAIDVNIRGTSNVQYFCSKFSCNLIQTSTADVYAKDDAPHNEASSVIPNNIYGYTKKVNEDTLDFHNHKGNNGLFAVNARLFNVFGSRDTQPHVITEIVNQLKQQRGKNELHLELGNIKPKRDFIHATDVANGLISIANGIEPGIHTFNLGSGESWSIEEIISKIEDVLQKKIIVEISQKRFRKSERMNLQSDITKIRKQIGWSPKISIDDGLDRLMKVELS